MEYIDALRAMAAFYVLFYHMVLLATPNLLLPLWLQKIVLAGGSGVTLFFVLSAFSLCHAMEARGAITAKEFYTRRVFRILPLFYVMAALYYLRDAWIFGIWHEPAEVIATLSFAFNLIPHYIESYVWAGWTIGVEMIFYLIFPYLYRKTPDILSALTLFLLANLVSWGWGFFVFGYGEVFGYVDEQHEKIANHSFLFHFPVFCLGILIYRVFLWLRASIALANRTAVGCLLIVLFIYLYMSLLTGRVGGLWSVLVWQGLAYGALLLGLSLFPVRILVNRITSSLGKMSYSIYLLHPTLVFAFSPIYQVIYRQFPFTTVSFFLCIIVTMVPLLVLSYVGYRYVERPGIRTGELLLSRWGRQPQRSNISNY